MQPEFAYSTTMELFLAIQTYITHAILMYLIANLILTISNEKASFKQKLFFAFWIGCVFYTSIIYGCYAFLGDSLLIPIIYALVTSPNPILGYLYYIVGCKILKLSPVRSIKLMGYFYAYFVFITNIMRLLIALMPIETSPRYNYLQNAERLAVYLIILFVIYFLTKYVIIKTKLKVRLVDSVFIDLKKERLIYLAKILFLYTLTTLLPMGINDNIAGSVIVILVLLFFFALNIVHDLFASLKVELENKEVHINLLSKAANDFSGIKHDLNNILQTYSGYLELGSLEGLKKYHSSVIHLAVSAGNSLDLSRKMEENPAFISLLASKLEHAEKTNVAMTISLLCNTNDLYVDSLDICRCVACLLDNAIEAAVEAEQKKVCFTLEQKPDGSKLMIITNNTAKQVDITSVGTAGVTSKKGHRGLGLNNVRKILSKYGNCAFNITYYNFEFSAYMELRRV